MNYKFTKRPVEVEAFRMTKERRWDNSDWPHWLHMAWQMDPSEGAMWCDNSDDTKGERLYVGTLEGVHIVSWGDWIIQGVKGELYPCKDEIFQATYDSAVCGDVA